MSSPIIRCQDITFGYDKENPQVLRNIDLEILPGEFICIVGANGSGKSTLAKMFNALLVPDTGTVTVNGLTTAEASNIREVRQKVGMVFQNPDNQIVATIVEEDVAFGPENLGVPPAEIRARVDQALKTVDMYEYRLHAPHLLSGGQKQRIAIAGILAIAPDVIIFDESTAMLDPNGRQEVLQTIKQLHQEQHITVIFITHHMEEAIDADRVLVMSAGQIIMDDKPVNIFCRSQELQKYHLALPQIAGLADKLRECGLKLEPGILTVEKMVDALCQLK